MGRVCLLLLVLCTGCAESLVADPEPIATLCTDGDKSAGETDVDCGGDCVPCGDGAQCLTGTDCTSGVCDLGVCAAPTCDDSIRNGQEIDVDCGGSCGLCTVGQSCSDHVDCDSRWCVESVCSAATCDDRAENQDETDVDCGGSTCLPCALGKACGESADCADGVCGGQTCASHFSAGALGTPQLSVDGVGSFSASQSPPAWTFVASFSTPATIGSEVVFEAGGTGAGHVMFTDATSSELRWAVDRDPDMVEGIVVATPILPSTDYTVALVVSANGDTRLYVREGVLDIDTTLVFADLVAGPTAIPSPGGRLSGSNGGAFGQVQGQQPAPTAAGVLGNWSGTVQSFRAWTSAPSSL